MAFLSEEEIAKIGFKKVGRNAKISDKAVFHHPECISIGDNCRISDFCLLSNRIELGNNIDIAVYTSLLSGADSVIEIEDFAGFAYRCTAFTGSDDYSGKYLTNPTVPSKFRGHTSQSIRIGKHAIIGTQCVILPGADIAEGVSVWAMSLVTKPTEPWKIYFGVPAKAVKRRRKDLLELEKQYLAERDAGS